MSTFLNLPYSEKLSKFRFLKKSKKQKAKYFLRAILNTACIWQSWSECRFHEFKDFTDYKFISV